MVASKVLGINVVRDAVATAGVRTGAAGSSRPVVEAIVLNTRMMFPLLSGVGSTRSLIGVVVAVLLLLLMAAIGLIPAMRSHFQRAEAPATQAIRRRAPLLVLALLPYGWLVVLSQHSAIHAWFTYRMLAITLFVVIAVTMSELDLNEPSMASHVNSVT